jgi:hypothetical protein
MTFLMKKFWPKFRQFANKTLNGRADAIVTGDDDLRADDELRNAMAEYGVQLWGVESLLSAIEVGE